jgi:capsid portal protein
MGRAYGMHGREGKKNTYNFMVGKPEGKRPLDTDKEGRNIKIDLNGCGLGSFG